MSYKLTISRKNNYLHARVTGENTAENIKRYLGEVAENVAVNRGLPVRVFSTVAAAEEWLAEQD